MGYWGWHSYNIHIILRDFCCFVRVILWKFSERDSSWSCGIFQFLSSCAPCLLLLGWFYIYFFFFKEKVSNKKVREEQEKKCWRYVQKWSREQPSCWWWFTCSSIVLWVFLLFQLNFLVTWLRSKSTWENLFRHLFFSGEENLLLCNLLETCGLYIFYILSLRFYVSFAFKNKIIM